MSLGLVVKMVGSQDWSHCWCSKCLFLHEKNVLNTLKKSCSVRHKCHRTSSKMTKGFVYCENCDVNEHLSPAGMREAVLQVTLLWGDQHLLSLGLTERNVSIMFQWINVTFPHVTGRLWDTQLDSPNWHFDHLHMSLPHHTCFMALEPGRTCEWLFNQSLSGQIGHVIMWSIQLKGKSNTIAGGVE